MKVNGNIAERFRGAVSFEPAYLKTFESGELARKVEEAVASLEKCRVCPWHCEINRMVTPMEYQEAVRIAYGEGLRRLDERRHLSAMRPRGKV